MRVIIAGSRDITDVNLVILAIKESNFKIKQIVSGGAKGVDSIGEYIARKADIPLKIFPADWNKYKKAAGPIRNKQMAEYADSAIVVHNGSRGSLNMIEQMKKLGKPVFVKEVEK